jgi:hypothetical protein
VDETGATSDKHWKKMKIISQWRDYYDHVAHIYGGGDPKVIYNRDYVVPDRVSGSDRFEDTLDVKGNVWTPNIPSSMEIINAGIAPVQKHEFSALIVMDRLFILERQSDMGEMGVLHTRKDWHITARPLLDLPYGGLYPLMRMGEAFTDRASLYEKRRMRELLHDDRNDRFLFKQGSKYNGARDLCKFAGAPVFVLQGNRSPCISGRTPKLSALGLAAYIDPQQLYQELAMFVGNVLNPVEQPPSSMKDIEKVASHGFDKKISFRHRK